MTTSGVTPYRSAEEFLRTELDARLVALAEAKHRMQGDAARVLSRRVGRSAAGLWATCGAVAMVATALARTISSRAPLESLGHPALTAILVATVATTPLAYLLGRALARFVSQRPLAPFARSTDVHADLARVARWTPAHRARERARRWEQRSVAFPLIGASLVAPLTLHLPFGILFSQPGSDFVADFDKWIMLSMAIVGHAHLILAFMGYRYARALSRWRPESGEKLGGALRAMVATCAAGLVPGAVLLFIPPILVGITGIVFVPASYAMLRRAIVDERRILDAPEATP